MSVVIGAYLEELRKLRGVNQEDLAAAIGRTARTIWNYESGVTDPPLGVLLKLFEHIGGSVDDIESLKLTQDIRAARARAQEWVTLNRTSSFSTRADEAARIVQALIDAGETDLASQYLGIGRKLLRRAGDESEAS